MLTGRKRMHRVILKSSGLPTQLSEANKSSLLLFQNFQAPQTFDDDEVKIWAQAMSVIALSNGEVGTLLMMPTEQPDEGEEIGIEFLMSVNSWIVQVTSVQHSKWLD
jgi:hypothetical protein